MDERLDSLFKNELTKELAIELDKRQNLDKIELVNQAFDYAYKKHDGQLRKSGEPFIIHPIAVAVNLLKIGMPLDTVAAGLLHDTVEDTDTTVEDIKKEFGDEIALIVDGVTKIDQVKLGDNAEAETVRKMIIAMSKDIRVLIVKLCDRLHNARTWEFMPKDRSQYKAKETLEIYAPLAHRLGLSNIKLELENLSFETLHPTLFYEIKKLVDKYQPESQAYVDRFMEIVKGQLQEFDIKATVYGRPKHLYSIYKKMVIKNHEFKDIYDLVAIRILVDNVKDCYSTLGAIHAKWMPIQSRFKDYIAMPKINGYQSIHTTVIGDSSRPVEVQIRTVQMNDFAENGVAAHWLYKDNKGSKKASKSNKDELQTNLLWVKLLKNWQEESTDSKDFLDDLRFDLTTKEVYVFTPAGKVITLPEGATPVDFAYAIHTDVGHKTVGAKINGKMVPLNTVLENGVAVEVMTSKAKDAGPTKKWLEFIKSPRAKNKIRAWFSSQEKEENIERGKELLVKEAKTRHIELKTIITQETMLDLASRMSFSDVSGLYNALGEGVVSSENILNKIIDITGYEEAMDEADVNDSIILQKPKKPTTTNPGVIVKGVDDLWVKIALCCTPVPPDEIIGFITKGHGVSVHRVDCENITKFISDESRIIEASWSDHTSATFYVQIQISAMDRVNLLNEILVTVNEDQTPISSVTSSASRDRVAHIKLTLEIADSSRLDVILSHIRKIDGVFEVYRV
jgi:GTP pyrophosphokinase